MTTFYVSNDGSDSSNAGDSPEAPWATTTKVNALIAAGRITLGDTVKFRSGDTFYGGLRTLPTDATSGPRLIFGRYGAGPKPKISAYKICKDSGWTLHAAGIWKIDLTVAGNFDGNPLINTNIGFIRADGQIWGAKRFGTGALAAQWDFYSDESQWLYVKSSVKPSTLADEVCIAPEDALLELHGASIAAGLDLVGAALLGVSLTPPYATTSALGYIDVIGCTVHEIGGGRLLAHPDPHALGGNGIQAWIGFSNVNVLHNEIYDVYEVAFTMQGTQDETYGQLGWTDVHAKYNRIWNCQQGFEVWSEGDNTDPGSGFTRCSFTDNTVINSGRSWGHAQPFPGPGLGSSLLIYNKELPHDIDVMRNVFFDPADNHLFCQDSTADFTLPDGYRSDYNTIFLRPDTLIQHQTAETIADAPTWSGTAGIEEHSTWITIPDSVSTLDDSLAFIAAHTALGGAAQKMSSAAAAHGDLYAEIESLRNDATLNSVLPILRTGGSVDYYRIVTDTLTDDYVTYDGTLAYFGESDDYHHLPRESGFLSIRFNPAGGNPTAFARLDVTEIVPFDTESARWGPGDFIGVIEVDNKPGTTYRLSVYLRRTETYSMIRFKEINSNQVGNRCFVNLAPADTAPISALPAGTQVTPYVNYGKTGRRVLSAASASSLTPNADRADVYAYTALAAALTINAPTGNLWDGKPLDFRIEDNGSGRALTWNSTFRAIGVTLPTTTTANKTLYVSTVYNADASKWDVVDVKTQA